MPTDLDLANVTSDDEMKVGALADGLANSAVNDTDTDGGSNAAVGVANAADSNNTADSNNDNSVNTSDSGNSQADGNGDNRDNSYDFDSKVNTAINTTNTATNTATSSTDTDTHIKDSGNSYSDSSTTTKDSGNAYSYSDSSTTTKDSGNAFNYSDSSTTTKDSGNVYADASTHTKDSNNSFSDSSTHYDFGTLKDVSNEGNLGIAGGDLNFHLGDDYSFNLNLDNVLNNSLGGEGNDTGFSLVQANNLADQDQAYNTSMDNSGAHNNLHSSGGDPTGAAGVGYDASFDHHAHPASSDNSVGHDQSGSSTTDASSILANSGFHQEIVQGANMVSNAADIAITGGNDHHDTTSTT